jgi:hypothetical protein
MFTADLLERAVKTFIQTFLTVLIGGLVVPGNIADWNGWKTAGLAALAGAFGAALSAAMSVLSKPAGNKNTASIVQTPAPPAAQVSK